MDITARDGAVFMNGNRNAHGSHATAVLSPPAPVRKEMAADQPREDTARPNLAEPASAGRPQAPPARQPRRLRARLSRLSVRGRLVSLVAVVAVLFVACFSVALNGLLSSRGKVVQSNATFTAIQTEMYAYQGWIRDDGQTNAVVALATEGVRRQHRAIGQTFEVINAGYVRARTGLDTLERTASDRAVRALAARALVDLAAYNATTEQVEHDLTAGDVQAALNVIIVTNAPASHRMRADWNAIKAKLTQEMSQVKAGALSNVSSSLVLLVVMALVALALAAAVGRWVFRSITRPLATIGATLDDFTAGNLEARAEVATDDELGHVAGKLNEAIVAQAASRADLAARSQAEAEAAAELRAKVEQILKVVSAAASGDLTVEVPVLGDDPIGQVGQGLAGFLADLRSRMSTIGESSHGLAGAAEELTATAAQMSAGAEETHTQANVVSETSETVSANVQTVAAAAEELSASIREIAKNAADAARVATTAAEVAESTNTTIGKLGESSAEIGKVIKVITSIAQQTNLLALNATIEAARAGDAGKGFAVVANEVKDLARETAMASEDISAKIEAIQADTAGAVEAISSISEIVATINDIQHTIASAVEEQTATTNEIARNVSVAAQGAADITTNVAGVAVVSESTLGGAADTERAAGELARMASGFQQLVGQFRF